MELRQIYKFISLLTVFGGNRPLNMLVPGGFKRSILLNTGGGLLRHSAGFLPGGGQPDSLTGLVVESNRFKAQMPEET